MAKITKEGETQLVAFKMGGEEFACNIKDVNEVIKMLKVTPLPRSLNFIEGMINMRGEVISVIDLRKRFGMDTVEQTKDNRIIIVEVDDNLIGLIVDSVSEVTSIPNDQIQEAPNQVAEGRTDLITGVGKINERMLIILNVENILSTEEQIALEEVSRAGKEVASE